jgi:hypothetical protein
MIFVSQMHQVSTLNYAITYSFQVISYSLLIQSFNAV